MPKLNSKPDDSTQDLLMKRIIPCLDVDAGNVVKGIHFQNMRVMGDPVELARTYELDGADEIVFLDITATTETRPTALGMVERVASELSIPFTLGGGLRTIEDIYAFLEAGADKVALNTAAVTRPELVSEAARQFGSQCIVVAVDIQKTESGYGVFTHGGKRSADREARAWCLELQERGAGEILLTSIDRDGTGLGFSNDVTGSIARELHIPVIASGGAKTPQHLLQALEMGADAVLAATMFHSGAYRISEVKKTLNDKGIPLRMDFP